MNLVINKKTINKRLFLYQLSLFIGICFLLLNPVDCFSKTGFHTTYAQGAVSKNQLPKVIDSHPRLLIRNKPWAHGPDLESLREWSLHPRLKRFVNKKPRNIRGPLEQGLKYLLTNDARHIDSIINRLKKKEGYWPGRLYTVAILYDWIFNAPQFSDDDKRIVENKMIRFAEQAIGYGQKYHDMWSHFSYRPILDITVAGLAMHGQRIEADKYLAIAKGYLENTLIPGWRVNDGAWQGGWNYYNQGPENLFNLISAWSSATNEDLFAEEGENWVRGHMEFLISNMFPDKSPMESAGFGYTPDQKGGTKILFLLARAYQDKAAVEHLIWRNKWDWRLGIYPYLYYFPLIDKAESNYFSLSKTKLWGKKGIGYVQMRSGPTEKDTIIEFKCGDYFWSHQSHNQNGFTIFRNGRLAIQSGIFSGGYWGDHMLNYYRPTIGSNSVLVIDPDETTWVSPSYASRDGVKTNKGYIKEFGGQRSCYIHPIHGSAETCFTWNKYQHRKNRKHYFETGNINAYEVTDEYAYVMGDATMAYNNPTFSYIKNKPKLDLFNRQMVFLDSKYLVIYDDVHSLDPSYEKRWLLHSVGEPKMSGSQLHASVPFHIETYSSGTVEIENKGGRLYCKTLFPDRFLTRKVGGGARITEITPGENNTGNGKLVGDIKGMLNRVSPTIATEKAVQEDWLITFVDNRKFSVKGSKTGYDGTGNLSNKKKTDFFSKSGRIFIPLRQWQGKPKAGDTFSFSVLSSSHRFWVDGKNHAPPRARGLAKRFREGTPLHPGNWRIEVIPNQAGKQDFFMHFLFPCDRNGSEKMPDVEEIESTNGSLKGLSVDKWNILFRNKSALDQGSAYDNASTELKQNLIFGLQPQTKYRIVITPESGISKINNLESSKNGSLSFSCSSKCNIKIQKI